MGALTDTRKRCFVDLCFPSSPPPLHFPADAPFLKKLKTTPPPSTPSVALPVGLPRGSEKEASPRPKPTRFPPTAPLWRPVQGPQRNIRVFGLEKLPASAWAKGVGSRRLESVVAEIERGGVGRFGGKMGNLISRVEDERSRAKGKSSIDVGNGGGSGVKDGDHSGLKLDEYRRLVEGLQEEGSAGREPCNEAFGNVDVFRTSLSVPIKREDERQPDDAHVADRKVDEPMEMMKLESTPVRENGGWTKRTPLYKDLLEETARKYDSKLSSLEFEVKLAEKKISAFRIASEEKPKEDKDGPFAPLTEDDENDVSLALQDPDRPSRLHDVLVMHEESNIEITREIIQCLRHGAWLNDEVINLYFELLKEREKRNPKKFLKCHFFNTFFYKKLTGGREGYDFKSVRRWTTQRKIGYGLIECDKIFIPIHKEIHWCLAVINLKDEKFQYLDSLGKMDRGVLNVLGRYLVDEVKDKSNRVINVKSWKQEFVDNIPLQKNGWDCGVFMIKYADFFSRGPTLTFGQEHMGYFRRRTAKEILRLKAD